MTQKFPFKVEQVQHSKISEIDFNNLPFGKHFTDHMLEADFVDGEWTNVSIKPYAPIAFDPSMVTLHYGQAIFEGIKAYKHENGDAFIFRPKDNFRRFNRSAERMCMPTVPEEIFIEGMRQLIALDKAWIPAKKDFSLYIRPFLFATDTVIGVKPSDTYKFMIIICPSGHYYGKPMRICVEEKYTRAAPGGVGFAKNAGNYGASLIAAKEAREKGFDQVLWTDAFEHTWLQEVGTMNVMFVVDGKVITPSLEEDTILAGVTRDSAITILRELGYEVIERKIHINELVEAYKVGTFTEAFGTGTAATISFIKELSYKNVSMQFDTEKWTVATSLRDKINDIRYGAIEDTHNWMMSVD